MTRVLIVDDIETNRYMLRSLFEGHGYTVDEAVHGAEALTRARLQAPDLVVSDLLMPVLDGYALLRHWRADDRLAPIPFVVYTATYTDPKDERLAMDLGADDFIVKPAEPEEFMDRIREILERAGRGELSVGLRAGTATPDLIERHNALLIGKLEQKVRELEATNGRLRTEIAERTAAEVARRESELRYRSLFEAITEPLFVYDRETLRYLAVNQAAVDRYGYSRDEFLTMTIKDIRPPEDIPALLEMVGRSLGDSEVRGVWRHRTKSGEILEVEIFAYGLTWSGKPASLVEARDVTQIRKAGAELARTSQLLKAVVEGTTDTVFVKDLEGRYLLFNQAASRAAGRPVDEVLGRDDDAIFGPVQAAAVRASDRLVIESGRVHNVEDLIPVDGKPRIFQSIKAPYRSERGEVIGVIGVSRDITELKETQAALELRDRAIQQVSQGILITDPNEPDGPIIYASAGFERITGWRTDEVVGRNCRFLQGKDTDPETVRSMREAIAEGRGCAVEVLNYRKDGTPFWNALSINPVHDAHGRVSHFVGVQSDVTERRRLEDQYRQAQKMEAVGRLAGGVAHDFNNLLTIITGYTELMLGNAEMPSDDREAITAIAEAAGRAAALTRQLLGLSRQSMLQPRVVSLNAIVEELGKILHRLIGEDIAFHTVLDPGLGRVKVDPGQIGQVLLNLAVNARDAMPRGGKLTVETANVVLSEEYAASRLDCRPGPHVMLAMTDTGCGMTPEVQARIFDPFFTTKEVGKGTGLGLPMVFGTVRQSEGSIHVYSEPGRGTTFKLYFPAVDEPVTEAPAATTTDAERGTETILVVEDDPGVRGLTVRSLERHGYRVLTAVDGLEALRVLDDGAETVDLLLTDVVMPNMSGPELAAVLRARFPGLKVLFMSGYTDDAIVRHGLLAAEVAFVQKPYTPRGLTKKVREVLGQEPTDPASATPDR